MISEFRYSFNDLDILKSDIGELLGFDEADIPPPFPELIEQALKKAPSVSNIRGGYKIFSPKEVVFGENTIKVCNEVFHPSKIVTAQFKKANSVALFICTAGAEISQHMHEINNCVDPLLSYVFDIVGSLTVEKATDKIQLELENEVTLQGLKISDRFSPGYCEWSVSEQQQLFKLLPLGFCGITLSESSLMYPIKSVSGIIAIGTNLQKKGYQCHWCSDRSCMFGKIKRKKKI